MRYTLISWGISINMITKKMITLYAAFIEEVAKLKGAIAGGEILRKPLQIKKKKSHFREVGICIRECIAGEVTVEK